MNGKYKNQYRIESHRLKGYDYSQIGAYFITLCTKNHICYFGSIDSEYLLPHPEEQPIINFTDIGNKARDEWLKTPSVRSDMNIELDEFVIMPNHIHAILIICQNENSKAEVVTEHCVSRFGLQSKNLASIVRGFKSSVTSYTRKSNLPFEWQRNYYDRVIRDEKEINRIREYIYNNPKIWQLDKYYKENPS